MIIELNMERNRIENLVTFVSDYVNVLPINSESVSQYPDIYNKYLKSIRLQKTAIMLTLRKWIMEAIVGSVRNIVNSRT